jgi:hypothetical protein
VSKNLGLKLLVDHQAGFGGWVIEFIQICLWITSTKEGILNYKEDFSFSLDNFAWANSKKDRIVSYDSFK